MRYPASEMAEIVDMVEHSHLSAKRSLHKIGILHLAKSIDNLSPADVCFGRAEQIILKRKRIKTRHPSEKFETDQAFLKMKFWLIRGSSLRGMQSMFKRRFAMDGHPVTADL